ARCVGWRRGGRRGGREARRPSPRADPGAVRAHPELFAEAAALRLELPGRSAAQIASILFHRHGIAVSERTVRGQLRRAGLHREALAAEPKSYGRYEAARPNERWITDVLVGPWVPFPRREGSARAPRFLIGPGPSPPAGGPPVLRPRERPRLPGPAAPGHHPPRPRCPVCR